MAISTYMVFLMHQKSGSTEYEKLIDITEFPDLGGDPEMLDTTTLSDKMRTFIPGIQETEAMTFGANYDSDSYDALKALENKDEKYSVWLGGTEGVGGASPTPTGSDGKYDFDGRLSVHVNGGGVNEVVGMSITIAPSTVIVKL